uniref:NADH-ubiquinone oxidoreductase chain 2 n=1 Tax=Epiplatys singa TaxID=105020 RepID=Q9TD62_9TELE|nr:NADH dehydrogenase subunit II [Epiplatys singa]
MSPRLLTIFLFGLGFGTMLTFASSHWMLAWMGLEINTMAIIPLMAQNHHPRATEAATKYLLIQATAAATLLFASVTSAWFFGHWEIKSMNHPLPITIITLALALKLGLAPFHAWLPDIFQGLNMDTALLLATWQKLAPFVLLIQIQPTNPYLLIFLGLSSILIGGWGGLNQTQLRKMLAYSSIAHLGWMVLIIQFAPSISLMALLIYFIMTYSIFTLFKLNSSTNISSLSTSWIVSPVMSTLAPLILLSLGGLPPLLGFLPKWMILQELANQSMGMMATLAALSALLSLYFYLRLSYALSLTISPNNVTGTLPWRLTRIIAVMPLAISCSITVCLLPLAPIIITILL